MTSDTNRRVVGYTRVSTASQAATGYGLDAQAVRITEECARREWTLVRIASDRGVSSGKVRPELEKVLAQLDAGEYDTLMISKLDRLSRSLPEGAATIQRAARHGWDLVVLDPSIDMSTPSGQLIANMLLSIAEFERALIRQRTREGLAEARHQGKRLGRRSGLEPATLEWITAQHQAGRTPEQIADTLTATGVPTSRGHTVWTRSSVRYLLNGIAS